MVVVIYVIAGEGEGCLSLHSNQSAEWSKVDGESEAVGGRLAIQCVLFCFTTIRARTLAVLSKFIAV